MVASHSPSDPPVRRASTVIVLRPGPNGPEVLMVRRARDASFMGGARVFPGGALEEADSGDLARRAVRWSGPDDEFPWRAAALRELCEEADVTLTEPPITVTGEGEAVYRAVIEAGAVLDADRLAYVANWVTPRGPSRRFDARFYLTSVPQEWDASPDQREVFDHEWVTAREALYHQERGNWQVEFPTRVQLEALARYDTVAEAIEGLGSTEVERIEPRIARDGDGTLRVVLPGEPEYEELPA